MDAGLYRWGPHSAGLEDRVTRVWGAMESVYMGVYVCFLGGV